jgi:hypothetical protein
VKYATLEWVDWFDHRWLLEPVGMTCGRTEELLSPSAETVAEPTRAGMSPSASRISTSLPDERFITKELAPAVQGNPSVAVRIEEAPRGREWPLTPQ